MTLFSSQDVPPPLAERMRPRTFEEVLGQEHLIGTGGPLHGIGAGRLPPSHILWGPPGSGKTTLARLVAQVAELPFVAYSAVTSGVREIKETVAQARERKKLDGRPTLLFVDEIHRFNKAQQDAFLPHVEDGTVLLVGATTENPSFEVNSALLSRARVLEVKPLDEAQLRSLIDRALADDERGLGSAGVQWDEEARTALIAHADGDARRALGALELVTDVTRSEGRKQVTTDDLERALSSKTLRYDKAGEEHYNIISALHKSLRDSDPDATLYWLSRMLEGGEQPLYIARRLVRAAVEDVGLADPQALVIAQSAVDAYHFLGSPEGELAIAEAAVYLACAPKSNRVYKGFGESRRVARERGTLPVPLHLRNAPTSLMSEWGYGKGYRYAHDEAEGVIDQEHLPEEIRGTRFYRPASRGYEREIAERLENWRRIIAEQRRKAEKTGPDPKEGGEPR